MAEPRRFVIGDIHGCAKTFEHLLHEVLDITRHDLIFLIGDYIDRGPDSKAVLDKIKSLKHGNFLILALLGNHEDMLLNALDDKSFEQEWIDAGGSETLKSFGVNAIEDIPEEYVTFINRMGYYVELDKFFLVHASLNFDIKKPLQDAKTMLYDHVEHYDKIFLRGKKLVHAHTPTTIDQIKSKLKEDVVNIDGGCVYSADKGLGHMVALELDTLSLHVAKNIDVPAIILNH